MATTYASNRGPDPRKDTRAAGFVVGDRIYITASSFGPGGHRIFEFVHRDYQAPGDGEWQEIFGVIYSDLEAREFPCLPTLIPQK